MLGNGGTLTQPTWEKLQKCMIMRQLPQGATEETCVSTTLGECEECLFQYITVRARVRGFDVYFCRRLIRRHIYRAVTGMQCLVVLGLIIWRETNVDGFSKSMPKRFRGLKTRNTRVLWQYIKSDHCVLHKQRRYRQRCIINFCSRLSGYTCFVTY